MPLLQILLKSTLIEVSVGIFRNAGLKLSAATVLKNNKQQREFQKLQLNEALVTCFRKSCYDSRIFRYLSVKLQIQRAISNYNIGKQIAFNLT